MTYHNAAAILADPATAVVERAPLTKAFEIVNNPDAGSATSDIACRYDSERVEIGFNARYMVDAIPTASPDGGAVSITMADAGSPATITGSRDGWLGVLMPMRV